METVAILKFISLKYFYRLVINIITTIVLNCILDVLDNKSSIPT